MDRYIIFSKPGCPFCVSAVQLMQERDLEFGEVVFEPEQENILAEIKKVHDWRTVPMIFKRVGNDVKFIGGYTDFLDHLGIDE
tara:strand:- start:2883 stop:3131 length:249 start_codon:yes stop_codon:yes gene_type:complete